MPPANVSSTGSNRAHRSDNQARPANASNRDPNDAATPRSNDHNQRPAVSNTGAPWRRSSRTHRTQNRPARTSGLVAWAGWIWGDRGTDSDGSYSSDGSDIHFCESDESDESDGDLYYRQTGRRSSVDRTNRVRERMERMGQRMERMGQRMEREGQRMEREAERQTRTMGDEARRMEEYARHMEEDAGHGEEEARRRQERDVGQSNAAPRRHQGYTNYGTSVRMDTGITVSTPGGISRMGPFNGIPSITIHNGPRTPRRARASFTTTVNPVPEPRSESPPKPVYTEKHEAAASLIQQKFRVYKSLRMIDSIASEFRTLKSGFVYPETVDLRMPGSEQGHVTVRLNRSESDKVEVDLEENQPKLAYTRANYAVYTYANTMEKFLIRLDELESWGDKDVRQKRSLVAKEVGKEWATLKRCWMLGWIEKQGGKAGQAKSKANIETEEEWMDVGA